MDAINPRAGLARHNPDPLRETDRKPFIARAVAGFAGAGSSDMRAMSARESFMSDEEFMQGYFDASDVDAPEPSANRSHCYRHSFAVRRAEMAGKPIPAAISRANAAEAEREDAEQ